MTGLWALKAAFGKLFTYVTFVAFIGNIVSGARAADDGTAINNSKKTSIKGPPSPTNGIWRVGVKISFKTFTL